MKFWERNFKSPPIMVTKQQPYDSDAVTEESIIDYGT